MAEINIYLILIGAIGLDLLIGDPSFLLHPVQVIGFSIKKFTNFLIENYPKKEFILFWSGLLITCSTIFLSYSIGKYLELIYLKSKDNIVLGNIILIGLGSCLATKSLISRTKEISNLINEKFVNHNLKRKITKKVQSIVSRDVSRSSLEDLLRATTESLTENSVDGIFGPLFWIFVGAISMKSSIYFPGPLSLGLSYKAISTLDSMIGYKHNSLKYLGFFSAKFEDFATFIPSRLVVLTLPLISKKRGNYFSLIKRVFYEGKKYDSPNSGISECIFAYLVDIQLGGANNYIDGIVIKPTLNSKGNLCSAKSIKQICQLIYRLLLFWIFIFTLIYFFKF